PRVDIRVPRDQLPQRRSIVRARGGNHVEPGSDEGGRWPHSKQERTHPSAGAQPTRTRSTHEPHDDRAYYRQARGMFLDALPTQVWVPEPVISHAILPTP